MKEISKTSIRAPISFDRHTPRKRGFLTGFLSAFVIIAKKPDQKYSNELAETALKEYLEFLWKEEGKK